MALIDFEEYGEINSQRMRAWAKALWAESQPFDGAWHKFFIESPPTKTSWFRRMRNQIISKLSDIKAGCKIIFKGEYPDDYYDD